MEQDLKQIIQQNNIILFDAVCVICNGWARFLIKHDPQAQFKLASAQSPLGEQILNYYGMSTTHYTTMIVIINGQLFTESTALLKVLSRLGLPFSLMQTGYMMPRALRDFLYRSVALNRYKIFGKTDYCLIPSKENKHHFLEQVIREYDTIQS
ncbi:thiol-disulfide oxidoreductase DCC family protein [Acinetobacter zhairhuonensis]|uniref:thiol-disulfide oxidoreductase DCC family protein n=1 Tax=Acinetobacter sp. A7.4 TaxID=2919921 RepID=UPI001F4D38CB|nr:DCC1-like thiol-disulfide oxidoreductase family protein [Acinetobacter sp. A7.4]MCJ8160972.1 DCC1-like thiol-disulfide oxidoreductase family protein [Acinetobacter sp. A7.4]